MSSTWRELVRHMLDEVEYPQAATARSTREAFLADPTLQRAFARSVGTLGEATEKLPAEFRSAHAAVDWRAVAGMRDRLVHDDFGVDYELVWEVATSHAVALGKQLRNILEQGQEG